MTVLRQRDPRQEDSKHLAFIRTQPCCLPFCKREAEPAHLRMDNLAIGKELTGKGEKPHDRFTVPLCPYHHRIGVDCQHNNNEKEWWERTGINPWAIAASLWTESGGAARALEPRPVKRARKVAARKPPEQRTRVQSRSEFPQGRKLQSRGFETKRPGFKKSPAPQGVRA